jgi:hypothetical protein
VDIVGVVSSNQNNEPNKMNLPNKLKEFKVIFNGTEHMVTASSYIKAAAQILEIEPAQVVKMMGGKGAFANMRFSRAKAHLHKYCYVKLWNS